jgi:hypothetical protein
VFLRARHPEDEPVWPEAVLVDDARLDEALSAAGRSPQPLAILGAVWRRVRPASPVTSL